MSISSNLPLAIPRFISIHSKGEPHLMVWYDNYIGCLVWFEPTWCFSLGAWLETLSSWLVHSFQIKELCPPLYYDSTRDAQKMPIYFWEAKDLPADLNSRLSCMLAGQQKYIHAEHSTIFAAYWCKAEWEKKLCARLNMLLRECECVSWFCLRCQ